MALVVSLLLGGCDAVVPSEPSGTNSRSAQLLAVHGKERLVGFQKFIRGTGTRCARVTAVERLAIDGVVEIWRVTCADSGNWRLTLDKNAQVGLTACPNRICPQ